MDLSSERSWVWRDGGSIDGSVVVVVVGGSGFCVCVRGCGWAG